MEVPHPWSDSLCLLFICHTLVRSGMNLDVGDVAEKSNVLSSQQMMDLGLQLETSVAGRVVAAAKSFKDH